MASVLFKTPSEVLSFWFGNEFSVDSDCVHQVSYIKSRMPLWFSRSSSEFDSTQVANAPLLELLISDDGFDDAIWNSPKGLFAKILILDQFPRSIYRGTSKAFSFDSIAVSHAKKIVENEWYLSEFSAIERLFIIL